MELWKAIKKGDLRETVNVLMNSTVWCNDCYYADECAVVGDFPNCQSGRDLVKGEMK